MDDAAILLSEIDNQMRRLKDQSIVDYKKELLANNYPILRMLAERIVEHEDRLDIAEAAIAEALANTESQILPELSGSILMSLALGMKVCADVKELKVWGEYPMPPDLRATINAYERAAKIVSDEVASVTLEAIDEDDLDGDYDEDEDDATNGEDVIESALAGEEKSE